MKRIAAALCTAVFLWISAGCDLIIPPPPPLENPNVSPDDFTFDEMELIRDYEFIGVQRIDCGMIESAFTSYGKCRPVAHAIGSFMECDLEPPGKKLQFACLSDEMDASAVYLRLEFDDNAKNLDFSGLFGKCTAKTDGPAANLDPRYKTDTGYKACLFDDKYKYTALRGDKNSLRPSGMYLDLTDNPLEFELIKKRATVQVFDAPAALVLDARLLSRDDRITAFNHIFKIFNFYRTFSSQSALKPQPPKKDK